MLEQSRRVPDSVGDAMGSNSWFRVIQANSIDLSE